MKREPPWTGDASLPAGERLAADLRTDVCVIGAGVSGITAAYMLCLAGKSVAVLEKGGVASGATRATTAHLSVEIDEGYAGIERMHGEACARLAAQSQIAAINRVESIVRRERIDCAFERANAYLFQPPASKAHLLLGELEALHRAGVRDATLIGRAPLAGFGTGSCIAFANQAQLHPLRYLAGLARALIRNGGRILTKSGADAVEGGPPARVRCGEHVVTCDSVVIATHAPLADRGAMRRRLERYTTYVVAAPVEPGSVHRALYWDTEEPYHYARLHDTDGEALLLVGGEDHRADETHDPGTRHARIEAWARRRFPTMGPIKHAWTGEVIETADGLAHIGRLPSGAGNVYVATGGSGLGITHAAIAGMLLTDLIQGRASPWEKLYDPGRKTSRTPEGPGTLSAP